MDWCRDHGIWLDGGELGMLARWARAGGYARDAEIKAREAEAERRASERRAAKIDATRYFYQELARERMREGEDPISAILRSISQWLERR